MAKLNENYETIMIFNTKNGDEAIKALVEKSVSYTHLVVRIDCLVTILQLWNNGRSCLIHRFDFHRLCGGVARFIGCCDEIAAVFLCGETVTVSFAVCDGLAVLGYLHAADAAALIGDREGDLMLLLPAGVVAGLANIRI